MLFSFGTTTLIFNAANDYFDIQENDASPKKGGDINTQSLIQWTNNVKIITQQLLQQCMVSYRPSCDNAGNVIINNIIKVNLTTGTAEVSNNNGDNFTPYPQEWQDNLYLFVNLLRNGQFKYETEKFGTQKVPVIGYSNVAPFVELMLGSELYLNGQRAVMYCPVVMAEIGNTWAYTQGFTTGGFNIVFCGYAPNMSTDTLAHEIGHTFMLKHSFPDKDNFSGLKKFIFTEYTTDNVMDYHNPSDSASITHKISFWKWQLDKILEH